MPRGMKKNSSARKVSQRAIEERKQKEEQEAELARQQRIKAENKQNMKDAMITSAGGFLTILSLMVGLYGLISIPAIYLCYKGYKKNADYGWQGELVPVICIVLNVLWIFFQVIIIVSPDVRLWVYNLFYK